MKNLQVSTVEVRASAEKIINKYEEENNKKLKRNSNPKNYKEIEEAIRIKTKVKTGERFLVKYLYESTKSLEETMTFRRERVDALYEYFTSKNRDEYLINHDLRPIKLLYIPSIDNSEEEVDELKILAKEQGFELKHEDFLNLVGFTESIFWQAVYNEDDHVVFCITPSMLEDERAIERLDELFNLYISRLFMTTNISYLFTSSALDYMAEMLQKGHSEALHWTSSQMLDSKEFKKSPKHDDKIVSIKDGGIPRSLNTVFKVSDSHEKETKKQDVTKYLMRLYKLRLDPSKLDFSNPVESIQPLISTVNPNIEMLDIVSLIRKLEDNAKSISKRDNPVARLYWNIAYQQYYTDREHNEMKFNFKQAELLLNRIEVCQIFCVPVKRTARGELRSTMTSEQNKNVWKFLQSSPKGNHYFKTLLLAYEDSPIEYYHNQIFLEQDYLLYVPFIYSQGNISIGSADSTVNSILKNLKAKNIELFLTYPESITNSKQMLWFSTMNVAASKKWLMDFHYRWNIDNRLESNQLIRYNTKVEHNLDTIKNILKINSSNVQMDEKEKIEFAKGKAELESRAKDLAYKLSLKKEARDDVEAGNDVEE